MSTSDQQEQGPLTRKQLREIRLTGATPVITPEEAAAAAAAAAPQPPTSEAEVETDPAVDLPPVDERPDEAPVAAAAPSTDSPADQAQAPLTRRQVRERGNTAPHAIPVFPTDAADGEPAEDAHDQHSDDAPLDDAAAHEPEIVAAVPADDVDDADEDVDVAVMPVSASATVENAGEVPLVLEQVDPDEAERGAAGDEDLLADDSDTAEAADAEEAERPTVSSAFGRGVLADAEAAPQPVTPSFDELLTAGDSTGSQHLAPNTLIFTPSPGDGSLSGPVASTGEILVTGSYELPKGLGSQGHAHGTTDGKDIDAVLIDGELPPASSPTPIAASAAVSTIKPAGEVIRPPAPEKGNKLMLILAIVAGGLALALGVALIVAFTTNVF